MALMGYGTTPGIYSELSYLSCLEHGRKEECVASVCLSPNFPAA